MKVERSNQYREYIKSSRHQDREQESARGRSFIRKSYDGFDHLEISREAHQIFEMRQKARQELEARDRERITGRFEELLADLENLSSRKASISSSARGAFESREEDILKRTADILLNHLWKY